MGMDLSSVDFALQEMPGRELHEILRAYRSRGPVQPSHFLGLPAFVITSHAALLDAFRDDERFPGHRMYQASFEGAIGESFISMPEEERHRIYRKLATPAFRSRAIANYERERMRALADELLDELEGQTEFDLMANYAARFPYLVITRMLGLPRDREDAFHGWALALLRFRDDPAAAARASAELTSFLAPIVEARRRQPEDDVISGLVHAEIEGRALSDEEIFSHIRLLFPTGGETTHGSLGNLLYALFTEQPGWSLLCDAPDRIPEAVEEALRWETPIAVLPRMSSEHEAIRFHGVEMPPNSWVLFAIAGANRDPAIFDEPDRFQIGRNTSEMLTFGRGRKACPGMHLARKNMTVAMQALLERVPELELVDRAAALPRRTVLRCPEALHVRRR